MIFKLKRDEFFASQLLWQWQAKLEFLTAIKENDYKPGKPGEGGGLERKRPSGQTFKVDA
jgi:hypothetical protein